MKDGGITPPSFKECIIPAEVGGLSNGENNILKEEKEMKNYLLIILILPFIFNGCGSSEDNLYIPSAPSMLSSSAIDYDGNYTITWTDVWSAASYVLQEADSYVFDTPTAVYSGSQTSFSITSKSDGIYYYRVRAENTMGVSSWSDSIFINVQNQTWQKMIGGSNLDIAVSVQQTKEGGYITAGYSQSTDISDLTNSGDADYYITKLNTKGTVEWQKMIGRSSEDKLNCIQQTSDSGYIIGGSSKNPDNGNPEIYIVKLDSNGNTDWVSIIPAGEIETLDVSVVQLNDNEYIVSGQFYTTGDTPGVDCYLTRLNSNGDTVWDKVFGGSGPDISKSIKQTNDGGYIIAGYSGSNDIAGEINSGREDIYIVKLSSAGNIEWQKLYGGSNEDYANALGLTSDGGYIAAGFSNSTDIPGATAYGGSDFYILKLDSQGETEWQKLIGGDADDVAYSVMQTSDSGFIVGGYSESVISGTKSFGNKDYYLVKLDFNGNIIWQKMYGGTGDDVLFSLYNTSDAGVILAGYSTSTITDLINHGSDDFYILKLDSDGGF